MFGDSIGMQDAANGVPIRNFAVRLSPYVLSEKNEEEKFMGKQLIVLEPDENMNINLNFGELIGETKDSLRYSLETSTFQNFPKLKPNGQPVFCLNKEKGNFVPMLVGLHLDNYIGGM